MVDTGSYLKKEESDRWISIKDKRGWHGLHCPDIHNRVIFIGPWFTVFVLEQVVTLLWHEVQINTNYSGCVHSNYYYQRWLSSWCFLVFFLILFCLDLFPLFVFFVTFDLSCTIRLTVLLTCVILEQCKPDSYTPDAVWDFNVMLCLFFSSFSWFCKCRSFCETAYNFGDMMLTVLWCIFEIEKSIFWTKRASTLIPVILENIMNKNCARFY